MMGNGNDEQDHFLYRYWLYLILVMIGCYLFCMTWLYAE